MIERPNARRAAQRLLAIVAILALAVLCIHTASHWHSRAYDEDNCQICHMGHAAIPQPAPQIAVQAPAIVEHLAADDHAAPCLACVISPSIPRAPPA